MSDDHFQPVGSAEGDLSGRRLGDFQLLRRLGRGAMADVYLAEQQRLKRTVAVKVLRPELAGDRTYLQRFEIEAQAAASLVHANIVQIYEVGCIDRLHFIAQEYVRGQNLREHIARHGPLDLPHSLSIMRQVAAALAKAAEQGVVHRDIKPENILLTPGGDVKVADFGLARLTREGVANDLTQIGMTLGTPLYMSPEQVEGKTLDPRSDIYSFGVTCYQMLSGSPPFAGDTALAVAVQHLKKQPQPLESLRGDLPPALCRIVHRMLAKDPANRFPSARDLLRDLRRVQAEYFGDDWPEELPAWESVAGDTSSDSRFALTEKLDELMKASAAHKTRRWGPAWLAAVIAAAFLVGAAIAWRTTALATLLDESNTVVPAIPKQPTVLRQWLLASQSGTEPAWQAVIDYFPEKKDFTLRAQQQLAMIYLRDGDFDRAMPICEKLSKLGPDQAELRVFGLAGKCGILSIRGQYRESAELLSQFLPDELTSENVRSLVQHAIRRNRAKLGLQTGSEWDKWFKLRPEGEN